MIDKNELQAFVEDQLKDTEYFLTDLKITPSNEITVEIDSLTPGDIEECVRLTRAIEGAFDRDVEDYELEVGTAGLTSPLKVRRQYDKYIGQDLEVLTSDGRKLHGMLRSVSDDGIVLSIQQKVKKEGSKKPVIESVDTPLSFSGIKKAVYDLKF
ncbi:MAG: ribosome assembly cofactor RimP [Muribaculaceae bacterium]|nr:ribosome assembly cofactor RimP [Muribaculaceae bacterium]MDE6552692.1 ribosome assembly cofactor RimP [Muribaculaceae bacterium]